MSDPTSPTTEENVKLDWVPDIHVLPSHVRGFSQARNFTILLFCNPVPACFCSSSMPEHSRIGARHGQSTAECTMGEKTSHTHRWSAMTYSS